MNLQPSFSIVLAAKCGSGKSTLMRWIAADLAARGAVNRICVFTATADVSEDWRIIESKYVYQSNFDAILANIFDHQTTHQSEHMLLLLDDIIGSINFNKPIWSKLWTQFRHYRISWVIATQYIYRVPPTLRENAHYAAIFRQTTRNALRAVYESYGAADFDSYNEFRTFLAKNTEGYYFLFVRNLNNNKSSEMAQRYAKLKAPVRLRIAVIRQ